jgi:hypothetical protein
MDARRLVDELPSALRQIHKEHEREKVPEDSGAMPTRITLRFIRATAHKNYFCRQVTKDTKIHSIAPL